MKNPSNQKDVICFSKNIQQIINRDFQENIDDEATVAATANKEPISFGDGLLITTVASTAAGIFFGLRKLGVGQQGALLTSTSLVSLMFLPAIF